MKKDVEDYYKILCNQRQQLLNDLKDFEVECENKLIEPERLDQIKAKAKPLLDNWERWAYMMFLLNKPKKKKSQRGYESTNKKLMASLKPSNSLKAMVDEGDNALKDLKSVLK